MAETKIGVPSVKGIQGSFGDFALGAVGGAAYGLTSRFLGSGLIGLIAAPVIAGSLIKGSQGTIISTVAGFLAIASLIGGMGGGQAAVQDMM